MNTAVAIDTLATMRKLEKAGFKTEQAEAVAEVMANQSGELATKADLETLEKSLRKDVADVEKSLKGDITWLRWICGIILVFVGALTWQVFAIGRDVAGLVATLAAG